MAINKVEYAGNVLIDLTSDSVTPETLAKGATAHNAKGEQITGTMESGGGGGEVNMGTCTLKIALPSSSNYYFAYEKITSGNIVYQIDRNYASGTLTKNTVRCGSIAYIQASTIKGVSVSDGEMLRLVSGYGIAYKVPNTAGGTIEITLSA